MSETTPELDVSSMPKAVAEVRAIARRIGASGKYDPLERIQDAMTLDLIADELDARFEQLRPKSWRERQAERDRLYHQAQAGMLAGAAICGVGFAAAIIALVTL
jgi:hypothetical protein